VDQDNNAFAAELEQNAEGDYPNAGQPETANADAANTVDPAIHGNWDTKENQQSPSQLQTVDPRDIEMKTVEDVGTEHIEISTSSKAND
jgi:hypothetical protein